LIRKSLPSVSFQIVGSNVPADIETLHSEHFNIVGYVDDLAPIFAKTRVLVAPLFIGAGIKGKVIDALANGIPIVTTSVGAEGLPIANGVNAFVADSPQEFAEAITKLVQDDELWGSIRSAAIMSAKANFGRKRAAEQYRRLLAELEIYV
jgi:glycosyltransferase involved in cell wall biosynthesis